jgi:hypothetical protein
MHKLPLVVTLAVAMMGCVAQAQTTPPSEPPPGAIVLFDGTDLKHWQDRKTGEEAKWKLVDGTVEVHGGDMETREKFGDATLHVEYMIPHEPDHAKGQHRGNSGVYIQGRYEIQVLDSYNIQADWQGNGAIYKVKAPDKNVSKAPGQWQSYHIEFRAPRFNDRSEKTENARVTVIHNGEVIHNDVEIPNTTGGGDKEVPPAVGPLRLQDHGHKVRYRNIWIVPADEQE